MSQKLVSLAGYGVVKKHVVPGSSRLLNWRRQRLVHSLLLYFHHQSHTVEKNGYKHRKCCTPWRSLRNWAKCSLL